ncbi:MAG TPA: gas vesicle protein GvpJ [Nitrososphaerales archaeon]|nr:gas vesicle protein GvpJ [Nitrososphaerales archaeon]
MSQPFPQQSAQAYRPLLNIYDLIDRVLDKGLVIDANVSIALVGIEILVVRARIVVAGIDTFLRYATALGLAAPMPAQNGALSEAQ